MFKKKNQVIENDETIVVEVDGQEEVTKTSLIDKIKKNWKKMTIITVAGAVILVATLYELSRGNTDVDIVEGDELSNEEDSDDVPFDSSDAVEDNTD